jgi:hypothetical protein
VAGAMKTISICAAAVLVVALITIPFEIAPDGQRPDTQGFINLVLIGAVVFGMTLTYRYLTTRKRAQAKLIDEYRRLADMAITAQEHTDLRLEDLRVQLESLRKALKE